MLYLGFFGHQLIHVVIFCGKLGQFLLIWNYVLRRNTTKTRVSKLNPNLNRWEVYAQYMESESGSISPNGKVLKPMT